MNVEELDLGWADVLRRAERRPRVSRRVVAAVAAVVAVATAAPALGVILTRPHGPELPRDRIVGSIANVVDQTTGQTLLVYGRWKDHDGICYLVPHVRAGCLRTGEKSRRFISLPMLMVVRSHARPHRFVVAPSPRFGFRVLALPGGKAKIVVAS